MPQFDITTPDGRKFRVTAPDGATQEQVLAYAQEQSGNAASGPVAPEKAPNPTAGNSFLDNAAIGAGKAIVDMGRGARQIYAKAADAVAPRAPGLGDLVTGKDPSRSAAVQAEIDESRKRDAPLMDTAGGVVGNVAGNVAPALLLPGGGTYLGAAGAGAALGAVQPTATGESRLLNTAVGAGAGAAGKYIGGKVADALTSRVGNKVAALNTEETQNLGKDTARVAGQQAGYVVPPTQANSGSAWNQLLESFSGKVKTGQAASVKNQEVTNRLAKAAVGLPDDQPLSREALDTVRAQAGQAYKAIEDLPSINWDHKFERAVDGLSRNKMGGATSNPADAEISTLIQELNSAGRWTGSGLIADIKNLREMAKANFNAAARSGGDVGKSSLAKAQMKSADILEDLAERNLFQNGAPTNLIENLREARQLIAKTYTIEGALEGQNVVAQKLAARITKGKPMMGELETIGKFAQQFKDATKLPTERGASSLIGSPLDWAGSAALSGVTGSPALMALVGARPAARSLILSGPYQRAMTAPDYTVGGGLEASRRIANNPRLQALMPGLFSSGALQAE